MTTQSTNPNSSLSETSLTEKLSPYVYSESPCLASLGDETLALAGRVEDFVDSFMASPLAMILLKVDSETANDPAHADALSEQWLSVVLGPTLPTHLSRSRTLL